MTEQALPTRRSSRTRAALLAGCLLLAGVALYGTRSVVSPLHVGRNGIPAAGSAPTGAGATMGTSYGGLSRNFIRASFVPPAKLPTRTASSPEEAYTGMGGPLDDEPSLFSDAALAVPTVSTLADISDGPAGRRGGGGGGGSRSGGGDAGGGGPANPPVITPPAAPSDPIVTPPSPATPPVIGTPDPIVTATPLPVSTVPEPATWAMLIAGVGLIGAALRRRVTSAAVAPLRS